MLNPIEHAWFILKRLIHNTRGNTKYNTKTMKAFVERCIERLTDEKVTQLVNCCAKIEQVIQKYDVSTYCIK